MFLLKGLFVCACVMRCETFNPLSTSISIHQLTLRIKQHLTAALIPAATASVSLCSALLCLISTV